MTKQSKKAGVFFNIFADTFDSLYENKRNPAMRILDGLFRSDIEGRFQETFKEFGDLSSKSVFDIGCGSGVYAQKAIELGASQVICLDPAKRMLELTEERLGALTSKDNYQLIEGSFPETTTSDISDHVIIMGLMDYIEDPVAFFSSLKGLFTISMAISFPSKHWFRTPIRKFRYDRRDCPTYYFDIEKIKQVLIDAGFSNFKIQKLPGAGMDFHVVVRP